MSVFPFKHIQKTCVLRMNICDLDTLAYVIHSVSQVCQKNLHEEEKGRIKAAIIKIFIPTTD